MNYFRGFSTPIDPYRVLFPIALALGACGALLWPAFLGGVLPRYPGALHASVMMGGFQLCMAAGFLMTAAPRFTGTEKASSSELTWALRLGSLLVLAAVAAAAGLVPEQAYTLASFAMTAFIAFYFARRWVARVHSPPAAFLFVGAGLGCGVGGSLLLLAHGQSHPLGRALFHHGMMLGLVVGVGSRLITANLGWMQNPIIPISRLGEEKKPWGGISRPYWVSAALCLLFVGSFLVEVYASSLVGRGSRFALVAGMLLFNCKLHRLPRVRTRMATWLWVSAWCVLLGLGLYAFAPSHAIHGAHLMFIGGFGLMVFMIAARVTLSHGGFDLGIEGRGAVYRWVGALSLASAILRVAAGWAPGPGHWVLVAASSAVFLLGLAVWSLEFLGKLLRIQKERAASIDHPVPQRLSG